MIDPTHTVISIARQCELIQLSRASYYREANDGAIVETPENLELMRLIDEEYTVSFRWHWYDLIKFS